MFPRQKRLVYHGRYQLSVQLYEPARASPEQRVKDRDIASLCARTPFPSFIYLCLPAAGNARLSPTLFSGCSIIPLQDSLCQRPRRTCAFEVAVLTRHRRYIQGDTLPPTSGSLRGYRIRTHAALLNSHVQTTVVYIKSCISPLSVAALNEH